METFIRLYMGKPLQLLSQHAVETCSLHTGKATNPCRKLVLGSCSWWSKNEIANMGANVKTVLSHELAAGTVRHPHENPQDGVRFNVRRYVYVVCFLLCTKKLNFDSLSDVERTASA